MKDKPKEYDAYFAEILADLSHREKDLLRLNTYTQESVVEAIGALGHMGFVKCEGGLIAMGQEKGLTCTIEGHRLNETPPRQIEVPSFYVSKTTVSNIEYEQFDRGHVRTHTSLGDRNPATCITYGRAISYARWLNRKTGLSLCLPTEPQLYAASAPEAWSYSYQQNGEAIRRSQNVFGSYPEAYPENEQAATLEVDDPRIPVNYLGLHHVGGNVSVFTFGHFRATGHWGAASDGAYTIIMGGNFRTCPEGARVVTRAIVDISGVFDIVGIRLVHPDPLQHVESSK